MYRLKYRHEDEMKDSGIEWLGMIPKEWECGRIQQFFNVRTEKVSDKDYEPLSVTKNGVLKQLENVAKTNNGDNRKKVKKNDFVINSRADRKGSCGVSPFDGSVSLICHVLTPKSGIVPEYINHLFRNYYFSEEFFRWGTGIVDDLWSTNIDRMKKITIPIPMEQEKIANFLDIKTVQFDSIISKKEKLIEKLEEAKKSLISEVVTGKVKIVDGQLVERKPEEMKDSGVEWLGMIPKDWEVKKLGYLFSFKNGVNANASQYGKGIKFINVKEVIDNDTLDYSQIPNRVNISEQLIKENIVINGDVLFNRTSEIAEEVGMTTIYTGHKKVVFGGFVIRGRDISGKLIMQFKKYCLNSLEVRTQIISYSSGSIRKNISQSDLKNIYLTYPDKTEQILISNFLDNKTNHINNIITKTKLLIQKLKSAKQSLISEAVTGKIDLRDWEIVDEGGEKL